MIFMMDEDSSAKNKSFVRTQKINFMAIKAVPAKERRPGSLSKTLSKTSLLVKIRKALGKQNLP